MSDTHNLHNSIYIDDLPIDLLIHSGDATSMGRDKETWDFIYWFKNRRSKYKILIAGNHDFWFQQQDKNETIKRLKELGIIYLEDDFIEIEDIKIYGSPWTPNFFNWAFMMARGELHKKWGKIPEGLDFLITHGPAFGIGDQTGENQIRRIGDEELLLEIQKKKPKYHIFGHNHGGFGVYRKEHTTHINCALLDESYKFARRPVLLNLETGEII